MAWLPITPPQMRTLKLGPESIAERGESAWVHRLRELKSLAFSEATVSSRGAISRRVRGGATVEVGGASAVAAIPIGIGRAVVLREFALAVPTPASKAPPPNMLLLLQADTFGYGMVVDNVAQLLALYAQLVSDGPAGAVRFVAEHAAAREAAERAATAAARLAAAANTEQPQAPEQRRAAPRVVAVEHEPKVRDEAATAGGGLTSLVGASAAVSVINRFRRMREPAAPAPPPPPDRVAGASAPRTHAAARFPSQGGESDDAAEAIETLTLDMGCSLAPALGAKIGSAANKPAARAEKGRAAADPSAAYVYLLPLCAHMKPELLKLYLLPSMVQSQHEQDDTFACGQPYAIATIAEELDLDLLSLDTLELSALGSVKRVRSSASIGVLDAPLAAAALPIDGRILVMWPRDSLLESAILASVTDPRSSVVTLILDDGSMSCANFRYIRHTAPEVRAVAWRVVLLRGAAQGLQSDAPARASSRHARRPRAPAGPSTAPAPAEPHASTRTDDHYPPPPHPPLPGRAHRRMRSPPVWADRGRTPRWPPRGCERARSGAAAQQADARARSDLSVDRPAPAATLHARRRIALLPAPG
jgi:hypothetical protein